jgi:hypothetical protein
MWRSIILEEPDLCKPLTCNGFVRDIKCNECNAICWVEEKNLGYIESLDAATWKCGNCTHRNHIVINDYIESCKKEGKEPDLTWIENLRKRAAFAKVKSNLFTKAYSLTQSYQIVDCNEQPLELNQLNAFQRDLITKSLSKIGINVEVQFDDKVKTYVAVNDPQRTNINDNNNAN